MSALLDDRLAEIRVRFISALQTRSSTIQKAIESIETCQDEKIVLKEVQNELHKITGMAAPLGFRELGEQARDFEDRIELYLNRIETNQSEILAGLKKMLQAILLIRQSANLA